MSAPLYETELICRSIGKTLAANMPEGWGFTLMLFTLGEGGFSTFISNCDRQDMLKAIRELLEKIERDEPNTPESLYR